MDAPNEDEVDRRRDEAVRRALNTPPKPKTPKNKKEGDKAKKEKTGK